MKQLLKNIIARSLAVAIVSALVVSSAGIALPKTSFAAANATVAVSFYNKDRTAIVPGVSGTVIAGVSGQCPGQGITMSYTANSSGDATVATGCDSTSAYCLDSNTISKAGWRLVSSAVIIGDLSNNGFSHGICGQPDGTHLTFIVYMEPTPASTTPTQTTKPSTTKPKTTTPATTPAADTAAPSAPADFKAVAATEAIDLSWTAATDNVGVTSYVLERSTDNKTWSPLKQDFTETSYMDSDVTTSTKYYYRVSAKDAAGNQSAASNTTFTLKTAAAKKNKDDAKTVATDKTSSSLTIVGIVGFVLVLAAVAGFIWYRKRANKLLNPTVTMPPAAESTNHKSLKDMVFEDLNNDQHNKPPTPPTQP